MAINETISKGNKYRRLKDAANKVWQRISFWTAASDVEFENGNTLQSTLGTVTGITDSLTSNSSTVAASAAAVYSLNSKITSFSGSLSNLYNAFVAKGVTPSAKTLDACVAAVNTLQTTAYAAGIKYANDSILVQEWTFSLPSSTGYWNLPSGSTTNNWLGREYGCRRADFNVAKSGYTAIAVGLRYIYLDNTGSDRDYRVALEILTANTVTVNLLTNGGYEPLQNTMYCYVVYKKNA